MKVVRPVERFRKFWELPWNEQLLFSEAYFLHLTTGLILKVIPFRWIPRVFASRQSAVGSPQSSVSQQFESPIQEEAQSRPRSESGRQSTVIELMKDAIGRASRVSPWKNKCLVSSLAGRCMLRRRKIESQLSLGVAKDPEGSTIAHAWLKSGDFGIVERKGAYTELFSF